MPEIARLIARAGEVLFPHTIPNDFAEQLEQLPCWTYEETEGDIEPEWSLQIEKLNREFHSISEAAYRTVEDYYIAHWDSPSTEPDKALPA